MYRWRRANGDRIVFQRVGDEYITEYRNLRLCLFESPDEGLIFRWENLHTMEGGGGPIVRRQAGSLILGFLERKFEET